MRLANNKTRNVDVSLYRIMERVGFHYFTCIPVFYGCENDIREMEKYMIRRYTPSMNSSFSSSNNYFIMRNKYIYKRCRMSKRARERMKKRKICPTYVKRNSSLAWLNFSDDSGVHVLDENDVVSDSSLSLYSILDDYDDNMVRLKLFGKEKMICEKSKILSVFGLSCILSFSIKLGKEEFFYDSNTCGLKDYNCDFYDLRDRKVKRGNRGRLSID
jgi:hypothetical protein